MHLTQSNLNLVDHFYIAGTLLFTVYGQLILKSQIGKYGDLPIGLIDKLCFLIKLLLNPLILSGFAAAFLASFCWMAAMTKFELSYAYPYMGLAFILVMLFSIVFLGEPVSVTKVIGTGLVVLGLIILTRFSG